MLVNQAYSFVILFSAYLSQELKGEILACIPKGSDVPLSFHQNILLTVPRRYFFCGSFMFLFCLVFAMSVRVCLYVLCGHLLGKG